MFKLLYLSCHSTQEYQELSIFDELGIDFFSIGSYSRPDKPTDNLRPALSKQVDPSLLAVFESMNPGYKFTDRVRLTKEFVDSFDAVFVSHFHHYVQDNFAALKHKPIIYAPVGQSTPNLENFLLQVKQHADLTVQRVSTAEEVLQPYAGTDLVVRPIVDSNEFKDWSGDVDEVLTVNKWMKKRSHVCCFPEYCAITDGMQRKLYGQDNDDIDFSSGELSYEQLKQAYRDHRVFLSMGTKPAPFTYTFMEALMTGCPVVTIGPGLGNAPYASTYEAYKFLENGVDGFWSDDITELRYHVLSLLGDHDYAKQISAKGREKAKSLFDRSVAKETWREFFNDKFGLDL